MALNLNRVNRDRLNLIVKDVKVQVSKIKLTFPNKP